MEKSKGILGNESVFSRTQQSNDKIIGGGLFNFVIGITLLWGFAVNIFMVQNISPTFGMQFGFLPFIIGYFVCCFAGIMIFTKSDNPLISFIGYNLVVIPFGLVVNTIVSSYSPTLVLHAMQITAVVSLIMMILGSMFPKFFIGLGKILFMALIAAIIGELVMVFIFKSHPGIIDFIVAIIFSGYIGYDWARANSIPKTLDNAVDSAAALYMDIINLFLRILRILGRRN